MSEIFCPDCHIQLELKHGRYGPFFGCSNYPGCKYTTSVLFDESTPTETAAKFVNASTIALVKFCPNAAYLKKIAAPTSPEVDKLRIKGQVAHERVFRDKRCFIASHVFHDDHPAVESLRAWRDDTLRHKLYGPKIIEIYYGVSPSLLKIFGNFKIFKIVCRYGLLWFIAKFIALDNKKCS